MKILYIHTVSIDSKRANILQVLHMCNGFSDAGFEVDLLIPRPEKYIPDFYRYIHTMLGEECRFKVVFYKKNSITKNYMIVSGIVSIWRYLKIHQYDYVFSRVMLPLILSMRRRSKIIYETHNFQVHTGNAIINKLYKRLLRIYSKRERFVRLVSISAKLDEEWRRYGIDGNKTLVCHSAVSKIFAERMIGLDEARAVLGLTYREIVLYAGSLDKNRRIDRLLNIAYWNPGMNFLILGGTDKQVRAGRQEVEAIGVKNVIFTGHINHAEISLYLSAADVLLMIWSRDVKTIDYCSPLKMFEYMAAGKIIVGQKYPTILEVLTNNKNSLLVDPDSTEALNEAVRWAMANRNKCEYGKTARELALSQYTWEKRARLIMRGL